MMKRNIKQHTKQMVSLFIVVILLCGLTACSNEESNIQVMNSQDTQPEYLSFFSSQNIDGNDITKYWSDQFMEKYNKQVYINFDGAYYYEDGGLSYRELLEKRLASSAPDDLYIINAEDVLAFEKKGYWMDLSNMDFVKNLSDAALYQSTYNGKVFSIPLSFTGFGFAWNVDLLTENGLKIPQNLEEFLEVCGKLKNAGVLPYGANKGYALTVPAMCVGFADIYGGTEQESEIAALNSGDVPVSNYMRAGFQFLAQMIENGYLDPKQATETTPHEGDVELFLSGECAFICTDLSILEKVSDSAFQIQITGLPVLPEGCIAVYGASSRLCVNPNSSHLDTACDFVEMLGTPEGLAKSAELDNSMSSAKDGATDGLLPAGELTKLLTQPGQIPNQDFALHFNTWESIRDVSREICGGASVEEACMMLDEKQRTELETYGVQ